MSNGQFANLLINLFLPLFNSASSNCTNRSGILIQRVPIPSRQAALPKQFDKNVFPEESQNLSYNEVLKICKWLNFDTSNKVFKGATDYLQNSVSENQAVNKIIEIALKNKKTYIMTIGAITNIALAIKKELKIIDKIEVIWLGGHSLL